MDGFIPVLVTTSHRGVFFGWLSINQNPAVERSLYLERCRNCIFWAASVGGFLGLARTGPNAECRIGAEAPRVLLHDITSVSLCTDDAAKAWAEHP
jgi:hypothetical protein